MERDIGELYAGGFHPWEASMTRPQMLDLLNRMANLLGLDPYGQEDPDTWDDKRLTDELRSLSGVLADCVLTVSG